MHSFTGGIRSEIFFAAYAQGEEPENEAWVLDFTEWIWRSQEKLCWYDFVNRHGVSPARGA